ncbi:MAG: hypothetical protein ACJAVN_000839 [Roseivirga sp.]|jgi:hypothetical protein
MKDNKIDDLFRKGLASHKISAPSNAWDKIESQLPKQSKKGIYFWISIAASLALVFTFGWIMISNFNSEELLNESLSNNTVEVEKEDASPSQETPKTSPSEIVTPEEINGENLVAESTSDMEEKDNNIPSATVNPQILQLNAQIEASVQEVTTLEIKEIELIKIDQRFAPRFEIIESIAQNNFMIDISVDLEAYLNSFPVTSELPDKRKRFSLLSGIVNVAKGVNSGKIALSEMRKSKNDFFTNDLKYGSSEGEDEDLEDNLDKQEDNLNKK